MARVLTIIGDKSFALALCEMLEVGGHEIIESTNGLHGLWLYMTNSIDIVIIDTIMPEKESFGTICEFRESYPRSRIIGISDRNVFDRRQLRRISKTIGINTVLEKPLIELELKVAVDGLLMSGPAKRCAVPDTDFASTRMTCDACFGLGSNSDER